MSGIHCSDLHSQLSCGKTETTEYNVFMVIDCFTFLNEFELLEIRLRHLWDFVDKFVIVEADHTHRQTPKPFNFRSRMKDFAWAASKVIYIPYHFPIERLLPEPWTYENDQRNAIALAFEELSPDDIVMVGDLDELPSHHGMQVVFDAIKKGDQRHYALLQKFHLYTFDCRRLKERDWPSTVICLRKNIPSPQWLRSLRYSFVHIPNGGHHFSYLTADPQAVLYKLGAWAHAELDKPEWHNANYVTNQMTSAKDLFQYYEYEFYDPRTDPFFPQIILKNADKYRHLFRNPLPTS
jgi:hypothetical protein